MKKEIWKDIKGFKNLYQISSFGRLKSLKRTVKGKNNSIRTIKEKIITPTNNGKGYLVAALYKNGKRYFVKIHRLVAEAFIPNPKNKKEVNHKDGIKKHNYPSNLEWSTTKENCQHRQKTGLGNIKAATIAKYKPVIKYDLQTNNILSKYKSAKEASIKNGGYKSEQVACVCRGERKSYHGFGFKYI